MPSAKKKAKKSKRPKKPTAKPRKKAAKKIVKKTAKKPVRKLKTVAKPNKSAKKPKKGAKKKTAKPAAAPTWHLPREGEILVGLVEDYLSHLGVILTTLKTPLAVGEAVSIRGFTTNIDQTVQSMQIEHAQVSQAEAGAAVGIKVGDKVRKNDHIFKKK